MALAASAPFAALFGAAIEMQLCQYESDCPSIPALVKVRLLIMYSRRGEHEMRERGRILIVEDDCLIATSVAEVLEAAGWQVVGPVGHLAAALDTAASECFDAAVLDVNLHGQAVYPVAEMLSARKVPFVFLTGYGAGALVPPFCERPWLSKPFRAEELIGTVARLIAPVTEAGGLGLAIIVGARSAARGDQA